MREFLSNTAHLHVVLNHVPTIGFCVGLVIFLIGLVRRHDSLKRTGLTVFFVVANVSIATYVTGVGAEELIKDRPDVSATAIRAHEDAALLAFALMETTGFFAWLALWQWRRIPRQTPRATLPVVLVLSVVTFALMANAANLGGEISHAEIRAASAATTAVPDGEATGVARSLGMFVAGESWVWPACETIHFVGLCMLFSVVLIVDLRMLGMIKSVSYAAVFQLLPLGMLGFGLNLITGMLFFIGNPGSTSQRHVLLEDRAGHARWTQRPVFHAGPRAVGGGTWRRRAADRQDRRGVRDVPVGRGPVLRPHVAVSRRRVLMTEAMCL